MPSEKEDGPALQLLTRGVQIGLFLLYLSICWGLTGGEPAAWTFTGEEVLYTPWFTAAPLAWAILVLTALMLEATWNSGQGDR